MFSLHTFGRSSSHPRSRTTRLRVEGLEARENPSSVAPEWFQKAATATSATTSRSREFIVQLNDAATASVHSVDECRQFFASTPKLQVAAGLGQPGQILIKSSVNRARAQKWLSQNPNVESFAVNRIVKARFSNDPDSAKTWGLHNTGQKIESQTGVPDADIDLPEAWSRSQAVDRPIVGVVDTGIDYNHPDLVKNLWRNPGEVPGNGIDDDGNGFLDDVFGYDFRGESGNAMDDHGHGTHVAGTIAAEANNGIGVAGVSGNSAQVMALKFLGANGSGWLTDAVEAINYATMMRSWFGINIRVLNNSWGGGGFDAELNQAIQASSDAGILFVAAAGNNASNNDQFPFYPANYNVPNVISVAASDNRDRLANFSNYGKGKVHLAAPGRSIYSTLPNGKYAYFNGTSMAAPHVAGAAALAWANRPNATVAQVKQAILDGVDRPATLAGLTLTDGRLNADRTLQIVQTLPPTIAPPAPPSQISVWNLSATNDRASVGLFWNSVSQNETAFQIEVSRDGSNFSALQTLPGSSRSAGVGNLLTGTTYWFRITGSNSAGVASSVVQAPTVGGFPGGDSSPSYFPYAVGAMPPQPGPIAGNGAPDWNGDGVGDLFLIKKSGTGSGSTEVHITSGASGYATKLFATGTALHQTGDNWDFQVVDFNRDGRPDLAVFGKNGTGSGMTEVHVLDGATNFQTFLYHCATTLHQVANDTPLELQDYNKDGRLDLMYVARNGTGTHTTEIHVLDGASDYSTFLVHTGTALHETGSDTDFTWADMNRDGLLDLVMIARGPTGTGTVELHALDGATSFQAFNTHIGSALGPMDGDCNFALRDYNGDNVLDLYFVDRAATGSGNTEVHVLNGVSGYQNFLLHQAASLPEEIWGVGLV